MVQSAVEQLKSDAFKLSTILTAYKVKLSSQQCLDVLSRLRWNQPYEAVLATMPGSVATRNPGSERGDQALNEWLACATSFCEVIKTLSREAVDGAAYHEHHLPIELHSMSHDYSRAQAVAVERFSRIAEAYLHRRESALFQGLKFSVEASEPLWDNEVAILRIQSIPNSAQDRPSPARFVPLGMKQRDSERVMFGAEARIELTTIDYSMATSGPYQMTPGVCLSYTVAGQRALKLFASVLQRVAIPDIWEVMGSFDVATHISLTTDDGGNSKDEEWTTDKDPDGARLRAFCLKASRLSDEVTRDWPPYFRLSCALDSTNSQEDLERCFEAICAHAKCIVGESGGVFEVLENRGRRG